MKCYLVILCTGTLFLISCLNDRKEEQPTPCPPFDVTFSSPYQDPVWHPSGEIIGFNYTPLKRITYTYGYDCPDHARYEYESDSAGFYLINADGTNQRRVLPFFLYTPDWSPDGKWIAFSSPNGTIFKMAFDGETIDQATLTQLTEGGRFWDVDWSEDGEQIAYVNRVGIEDTFGIWMSAPDKLNKRTYLFPGGGVNWSKDSALYYIKDRTVWYSSLGKSDESEVISLIYSETYILNELELDYHKQRFIFSATSNDPENPGINIWTFSYAGTDLKKIKADGMQPNWGPGNQIVFLNFNYSRIDEQQGTLWITDANGANQRQLTVHKDLEIIIP